MARKESAPEPEFIEKLRAAINETIVEILGGDVLEPLQNYLVNHYGMTLDEIPYRLDTVVESLEIVLGVRGARTIGLVIMSKFHSKIKARLMEDDNYDSDDATNHVKNRVHVTAT